MRNDEANLAKSLESRLRPTMLDPSLLCMEEFWESAQELLKMFPLVYVPSSLRQIEDPELYEFYGGYAPRDKVLSIAEVIKRSREAFRWFSWQEYSENVPEQVSEGFRALRTRLPKSYLTKSVQNILMDEFVFLTTQSSMLSRMKKPFKLFEKFDALPLLNLEKMVPEDWRKFVRGVKKAVSFVNWIGSIGAYTLVLGPLGPYAGPAIQGIRLILVDPA